ncbi:MAG: M23 family metallopeptidase [Acetatifactor sp.]|nr:M23 family metallopeptidase [Acetatifactor sp.]
MRRNRDNHIVGERIVMIASSAIVLVALTMAGFYMKGRNEQTKDDGYVIDFTAMEDKAEEKYEEIAQANRIEVEEVEDDLDYMPMEASGSHIEIPGLTGPIEKQLPIAEEIPDFEEISDYEETPEIEETQEAEEVEDMEDMEETAPVPTLNYSTENRLVRPVPGEILMHYSMDHSIYFATLDQYKYNPAVLFSATEGETVCACAAGKVVSVSSDSRLGNCITLDLGNGYQVIYGQLASISVEPGSYVDAGAQLGTVAAPSKYFSREGCNLYLQLTHDGEYVNPEELFERRM